MTTSGHIPTFLVKQHITMMVNRYEVTSANPDGTELVVEGRMPGRIIREQRGDNGFGYDVVFVADETGPPERTTAELPSDEKDAISHRGHALRDIAPLVIAALS